jgi:hypothetical protein
MYPPAWNWMDRGHFSGLVLGSLLLLLLLLLLLAMD